MSKMSRNKGASGEREILRWFEKAFPDLPRLERNHSQTAIGGADCLDLPGIALEVKRQETLSLPAWWRQTCQQAITAQRMPVLVYRRNREKWTFCLPANLINEQSWGFLSVTETEFTLWYREKLTKLKVDF